MVLILTITVFSFTVKTSFSSSNFYQKMEIISIVCIVGAGGCEFLVLVTNTFFTITCCCRTKIKNKKSVASKKGKQNHLGVALETEGEKLRTIRERKINSEKNRETPKNIDKALKSRRNQERVINEKKNPEKFESRKIDPCLDSAQHRKKQLKFRRARRRKRMRPVGSPRRSKVKLKKRKRGGKAEKKVHTSAQKKTSGQG